jgi:hypothetical protein
VRFQMSPKIHATRIMYLYDVPLLSFFCNTKKSCPLSTTACATASTLFSFIMNSLYFLIFLGLMFHGRRTMIAAFPTIPQTNRPSCGTAHLCTAMETLRAGSDPGRGGNLLERYSRLVDERPLVTKTVTVGFVSAIADLFSQVMAPPVPLPISWSRVTAFTLTGLFFIGPYLHIWYCQLNRMFAMPRRNHVTRTVVKMLVDQTVGVCIFFPLYFISMEISESIVTRRGKFFGTICLDFGICDSHSLTTLIVVSSASTRHGVTKMSKRRCVNCIHELAYMAAY